MKHLLTLIVIAATLSTSAQRVRVETDKFTHEVKIQTEYALMQGGLFTQVAMNIWSNADRYYICLGGVGERGAHTIGEADELLLLLDDGSTIKALSKGLQQYTLVSGPYGGVNKKFSYDFHLTAEDIEQMKNHSVKSFRIPGVEGYTDYDVKDKHADFFKRVVGAFDEAVNKK